MVARNYYYLYWFTFYKIRQLISISELVFKLPFFIMCFHLLKMTVDIEA